MGAKALAVGRQLSRYAVLGSGLVRKTAMSVGGQVVKSRLSVHSHTPAECCAKKNQRRDRATAHQHGCVGRVRRSLENHVQSRDYGGPDCRYDHKAYARFVHPNLAKLHTSRCRKKFRSIRDVEPLKRGGGPLSSNARGEKLFASCSLLLPSAAPACRTATEGSQSRRRCR
jgi:hypothetical protein